jgi:hypothetical protein
MVKRSLLLPTISTHTFALFGLHIGYSFELRDLVKLITNQWIFILTIKAL